MSDFKNSEGIPNKVTESGLITLDLANYYHPGERVLFDIKPWLFKESILREKDFREAIKAHDWSGYKNKNLAFVCSSDAIIPTWAYMLLGISAEPFANRYVFGDLLLLENILFQDALNKINAETYSGSRVIIKGCGDINVPVNAYVEITHKLLPYAKSIMYGEACSNVPLWKKKD